MVNAFLSFSPLVLNHIKFFSSLANLLKSSVQHLCEIWRELLSYEQVMKYLVHNRVNFLSLPGFISNLTGGVLIVYNKNLSYLLHISQEVLWFGREMSPDQGLINLKTWSLLGGTIEEIMKSLWDAGWWEQTLRVCSFVPVPACFPWLVPLCLSHVISHLPDPVNCCHAVLPWTLLLWNYNPRLMNSFFYKFLLVIAFIIAI